MTPGPLSRARGWVIPVLMVAIGALPQVYRYLLQPPPQRWQVDLEVYRGAGVSNLVGRPVYDALTEAPQLLPFTYPPFASILAIPLGMMPFGVAGWIWFVLQVLADLLIVRYAARGLLARAGRRAPWLLGLLTVGTLYLLPVSDGFRFGQVNAFLVLACLVDLLRPRLRLVRWLPQGVLIGLATAIKLTPGVFIVHLLVTRQWRTAGIAIGTAVGVTLGSFALLPGASFTFWGGALQDPARLGPNDGTSNQSLRGVLMRLGPSGSAGSLVWLVLAVAAAVAGFALSRRAHRRGDDVMVVAALGATAVLISPVSWIHHFHWLVVAIFALLGGDPRRRRRLAMAVALYLVLVLKLPWWGQWHLASPGQPFPEGSSGNPFWTLLNNSYCVAAVLTLAALWWLTRAPVPTPSDAPARPQAPVVRSTQRSG